MRAFLFVKAGSNPVKDSQTLKISEHSVSLKSLSFVFVLSIFKKRL